MKITVDAQAGSNTLKQMIRGPGQREICSQLSEYFAKVAGGLQTAKVEVDFGDVAKPDPKPEPKAKPAPKKAAKKKVVKASLDD